ncbi:MAG: tRNA 2-thiocytidine(32) synthetase TtcA [Neisseriaceae bacterium]|nr:tRNA 2-thiocytidine(32) synthetase TtcA [Neisseriaceae bacterium]
MSNKPKKIYEHHKLIKRLRHAVGAAIGDFQMIENQDRVMVCVSGGKDSYVLLDILLRLQQLAPIEFSIVAVHLDQGFPQFPTEILQDYLSHLPIDFHIVREDTYSIVKKVISEGKTPCGLCSRLRRGVLYRVAREIGATKIALGHHRDDIIETMFLNMFYGGKMKSMPPKLCSDNGEHTVIRPLAYVREKDIIRYVQMENFPIIEGQFCGVQNNLQRPAVKAMLQEWDKRYPGRLETIFTSLQNIVPSHLLDRQLFDFKN